MTSGKQSPAVTGLVSEARSGRDAAEKQAFLGIGGESKCQGPVCQLHGNAAEKNIARGTRKRYILTDRTIQLRVLNEVQQ